MILGTDNTGDYSAKIGQIAQRLGIPNGIPGPTNDTTGVVEQRLDQDVIGEVGNG